MFGSHTVITGGTFTQVNHNVQPHTRTPWDRLESAVAPAAFHNSAKRFDPPRCHPNTRVAVMDELRDLALRRGHVGNARILWLSGPAGAGKSAIAQSFCEECFLTNVLLASFFFNRSDPSRSNATSFVATLTYQIYWKVPPYQQSLILGAIANDPLVFERTIDAQFKTLIMDPLQGLFETDYLHKDAPSLIVIDGLDECATPPVQVSLLTALQNISTLPQSPFLFIIASRPEHDIQAFFRSSSLGRSLYHLNLDDSYRSDKDIELLLRDKIRETRTIHPLKDSIPQGWPSNQAIRTLVEKSSGQFIYASVVLNYITSSRHYPPNRLEVILQLRAPNRDLPFAKLDALYSHIFSGVDDITLVLRILRIVILFQEDDLDIPIRDIEQLCELDQGECLGALSNLQSVIRIEPTRPPIISLLHKSLPDYLQDPARSNHYNIDTTPSAVVPLIARCLQCIFDRRLDYNFRYSNFIQLRLGQLVKNIQSSHEHLLSFSLINDVTTPHEDMAQIGKETLRNLMWLPFTMLNELCILEGSDYEHVYYHHLRQFPKLLDRYPEIYRPGLPQLAPHALYENRIMAMITVLFLLGDAENQPSSEVLDLSQRLPIFGLRRSTQHPGGPILGTLSCSAARRGIGALIRKNSSKSTDFALKFLPIILPRSQIQSSLNEACLAGISLFTDATLGGNDIARLAHTAMMDYRIRYDKDHKSFTL